MKNVVVVLLAILSLFVWMGFNAMAATWSPPAFESPSAPLPITASTTYPLFDVQVHTRDIATLGWGVWDKVLQMEHGSNCAAPPATHNDDRLSQSVFICNGHVMTSAYAEGYGEIIVTPNQLLDCSAGCSVQWEMSTEKISLRDWPDLWLTPWDDNLTLPFEVGDVDLQGIPRRGIRITTIAGQGGWKVFSINNFDEVELGSDFSSPLGVGIASSVNQAAVRQTFKLTVTPGHIRLERLASATAPAFVWVDGPCTCLLAPDYVVQFGHHSYNPEKEGSCDVWLSANPGRTCSPTWHWFNSVGTGLVLSNATPFTLIHAQPTILPAAGTITFNAPTPSGAHLRFSALCQVRTDAAQAGTMAVAPKQRFIGHPEHMSPYFVPIQAGRTSVNVSFAPDDWYPGPCGVQDPAIWSKSGGTPSTPTPSPSPASSPTATPTPSPVITPAPTSTPTGTVQPPTATAVITSSPTPTLPSPTPTATSIPSTSTPTPTASITVTFDNLTGQDKALNGQYPTGLINWGNNKWWLAAPWGPFTTKSISFNNGNGTSRTFAFVNPRVLLSLKAAGISPSTITLACAGNPNKVQAIPANVVTTITTGWTVPCTTVTVASSNGWDTNFDDLLVQ